MAFQAAGLEAIMIGNAAAALQGAPVTTLDFDFMFRETPSNRSKLKRFAKYLGASVLRPYYPISRLYRVMDDRGLQVDFLPLIHGIRSFESLRSRSHEIHLNGHRLWVADLDDIIRSKRAAARPRDHAVLDLLILTRNEKQQTKPTAKQSATRPKKRI